MAEGDTTGFVARGKAAWQWVQKSHPFRTFSHFTDVGGGVLSAGMSYQAVFAVFAALWVGFSVFGIWLRSRTDILETLVYQINQFIPGLVGEGEDGLVSVQTLLDAGTSDLVSILAGLSLFWVTLTWFTGTRRAIRIMFGLDLKYRNAVLLKLRDFVLAVLFMAALLVSAALTVASTNVTELILGWLGADPTNWLLSGLGTAVRYAVLYVFDVLVLLAILRLLAEVRISRWALLRGSAVGGLVLFGLKMLGTLLLGGASSNPLLASFALFIGLLLWFNLICRTLLLTASWIVTSQDRTLGLPRTIQ